MTLETRIPPLIVVAIFAAAMWGARLALAALTTPYAGNLWVALALLAAGVAVMEEGARQFRRARTTVNPLHPEKATTIVDTGIFRITRNPMYVGMLLMLIGWAAYLANVVTLAGPLLFILYMNRFQIGPEERALTQVSALRIGPTGIASAAGSDPVGAMTTLTFRARQPAS